MAGLGMTGPAAVLLVGLSFRSAPVPVLEKASAAATDLAALEHDLLDGDCVTEALVLSTCNRMEFYVATTAFHPALDHVVETVADHAGIPATDLEPYLYVRYADKAAEHMLTVASGLDSMVVGEQQVIGQLRNAYHTADDNGTVGSALHELTQRALRTGKRVHTETEVDVAGSSMVSFALGHAVEELGVPDMTGRRALVVGAGAMASLASTWLGRAGVSASAVPLSGIPGVLQDVDLVVSATGAVGTVITGEDVRAAQTVRPHDMVLVDLSMPRDIDDSVVSEEGSGADRADVNIRLLNIEELTTLAGEGTRDEDAARQVVREELDEYLEQVRVQSVVPTVKALRQRASDVIDDELGQLMRRTPGMTDQERAEVTRTVRRVVDKILHTPTVQVKKLSSAGGSVNYAEALAVLFNLPAGSSAPVSRSVEPGDAGLARIGNMITGEAS